MKLKERIEAMGLVYPNPSKPGGSYQSINIRGNIVYVAIQFPIINEKYFHQGKLGKEISTEQGYKAMEMSALNVLAQVEDKLGFEHVDGLNHFDAYYVSDGDWDEAPEVVNGASDLFVKILGEAGQHTRAIFGVEQLPRNFCVGLTASFTTQKDHRFKIYNELT